MTAHESCGTCRHATYAPTEIYMQVMICRRRSSLGDALAPWPVVTPSEWCAEYAARPSAMATKAAPASRD